MLLPRPRNAAIEHIEHQSSGGQSRRDVEINQWLIAEVLHGAKYGRHAAGGVGQREEVGHAKFSNHREMLGAIGVGHRAINREWSYATTTEARKRRSSFPYDHFEVGDDRSAKAALAGNSIPGSL